MNDNEWKKKIIKFMSAQTISLLGSSLVQYAIIWYITLKTQSGMMMAISTLCGYVPQMAISLFAGVWLDRYNRKTMAMISDGIIALSTLIIALLFLSGYQEIWLLFAVLLIRSAGTGVQMPAVNAIIPQIVPQKHLMKVNGINSSISSLMMFLSPMLSGIILSFSSIEMTFFIDVITAIIGIAIMFTVKIPRHRKTDDQSVGLSIAEDIKAGFKYLKKNNFILKQLVFLIVVMILISPSAFLTPLLVARSFGAEIWRLTLSEMTFSLGAISGGILIALWGGFQKRIHTIILATIAYGTLMMCLGLAPNFVIYLIFNGLIGISMPCFNAPVNVMIQENVETAMHGRVFSIVQIANACALPFGTILFGPMADIIGVNTILIWSGVAVILMAIYHLQQMNKTNCIKLID